MILTEFDMEQFKRDMREDGYDEGLQEGLAQGAQQKAVEAALVLVKEFHATPETAAKKMNAPLDKVLEALSAQPATAQA